MSPSHFTSSLSNSDPAHGDDENALPLRAPTTQAIVADVLRSRIALGAYAPGDRLPTERELSEALGVGRTTVRAAIRELREQGLLETTKGRGGGSIVRERGPRRRLLRSVAERYIDDLRQSYDFRQVVEPTVTSWAASGASASQRRRIESIANETGANPRHYRALDSRFHIAIAEGSENRYASTVIRQLRAETFIWADALWGSDWEEHREWMNHSEGQHRAIAQAIRRQQADWASELMAEHLSAADSVFERVIAEVLGG